MLTLTIVPNLSKQMSDNQLIKSVFFCLAMDLVITLTCINL